MQSASPQQQFGQVMESPEDQSLLVKFYIKPCEDRLASQKEGRPIFVDREYISIRAPGSPDEVARPATVADTERFPRHYAAFKSRTSDEEQLQGTLLEEWPGITRSQAEEMKFFGVRTVEQLASMTDANAQGIRGILSLRQKAQDYVAEAQRGVTVQALKQELDHRDEVIAALQAQVEELSARMSKPRKKKVSAKKE